MNLKDVPNFRFINWWVCCVCVAIGVYGFLTVGPFKVIDIPFIRYYIGVYPPSLLIMAAFLFFLDRKYQGKALALFVMTIGAFDFLAWLLFPVNDFLNRMVFYFQAELMVGGWLLARRPGFLVNRYFVVLFITWIATGARGDLYLDYIYQVALFVYVLKSTKLREQKPNA